MYLKSLEISGFKSFAKKAELSFNAPISAIVGPNGSGKSNVAEAFRFVLGEQSIKSMRGKKTEDLIFNGGESSARGNRASVKLVFDNKKKIFNVDFDEVALERVIHRDSLSEYFINGTQVRLRDIVELLAGARIGSSGHHIISQGEADRILNSNTKERREMIEDALGLKVFQYKREESQKKLAKTRENMAQVESLRKEIAPHIKFLKRQVEKVEKTLALREELKNLYQEYLYRERNFIEHSEKAIGVEKSGPKKELDRLEHELKEARHVLESSKKGDVKSSEVIELEGQLNALRHEKDTLGRDIGRIEGEIGSLSRILVREQATAHRDDARTVPLREVETIMNNVEALVIQSENEGDISKLKVLFREVKSSLKSFVDRYKTEKVEDNTQEIESEIEKLNQKKKEVEVKLAKLGGEEIKLNQNHTRLRTDIEKEKDSSRDAEKALFRIMAEQNEMRGRMSLVAVKEEKLRLEKEDFKRELEEGGILIGREVYGFETHIPKNESGAVLSESEILSEPRTAQEDRRKQLEKIKVRIEDSGALSGQDIMKEYKEVTERDEFLAREIIDLEKSAESLTVLITDLETKLDTLFSDGIEKINKQFKEFFALMFGGGTASLSISREKKRKRISAEELAMLGEGIPEDDEPEEEGELGVGIEVNLPRKKIKGLEMLSGGERALTSIALLFAMSQVNPPPFIILDETDAALDEANSKKYGDMVENLSKFSQLIVITHNRETMSRAGLIYGVTMGREGYSKLLSIAFDEAVVVAK
jgi:chromosome segregation protein